MNLKLVFLIGDILGHPRQGLEISRLVFPLSLLLIPIPLVLSQKKTSGFLLVLLKFTGTLSEESWEAGAQLLKVQWSALVRIR